MVTTSVASPLAARSLLIEEDAAARPTGPTGPTGHAHAPIAMPVTCTILTPSGALLAKAMVRPRPATLPADTYAVEVSDVEPQGALEPLLRTNPQVVLRMPHEAQLALRIDHIVGPRERRKYYLQTLAAESD